MDHWYFSAIDISAPALAIARGNAERNGVADRIRFLRGNLLEPVAGEQFEIVVSNPPYVAESDRASLAVEVRDYEPELALYAGDGLGFFRRLIPDARAALVLSAGFWRLKSATDRTLLWRDCWLSQASNRSILLPIYKGFPG